MYRTKVGVDTIWSV